MNRVRWILALYLLVLLIAVSYPSGPTRNPRHQRFLNDVRPRNVDALVQDVARNIALFLPAGYLGLLIVGHTGAGACALVTLACALLSLGVETVQYFFLPWRYSTWIDVVSNTAGGLAGTGIARLLTVPVPVGDPPPTV